MSRLVKCLIAVVLVVAPLTYMVVASVQSVEGSERKEREAAATALIAGRPDTATRNIYRMPLPDSATWHNRFFETNSWKSSSLYMQFETTNPGLDRFLASLGISRGKLVEGSIPFTQKQRDTVGWSFNGPWAKEQKLHGITLPARGSGKPALRLVVNLVDPYYPSAYVVSTIKY